MLHQEVTVESSVESRSRRPAGASTLRNLMAGGAAIIAMLLVAGIAFGATQPLYATDDPTPGETVAARTGAIR